MNVADGLLFVANGGVGSLVFDRPQVLNAIDAASFAALGAKLAWVSNEPAIRVVVLRGAGLNFSAGADIREPISPAEALLALPIEQHPSALLYRMPKPTIAAIRGYCLGGGLELALANDIRVAAESSTFGFPEIEWGLTTGWGGSILLKRVIGRSAALEFVLTARRVDAAEAKRIGIVHYVVPDATFETFVEELANKMCNAPVEAVRGIKRILADNDFETELRAEIECFAALAHTPEAQARLKAFGRRANVTS